MTQHDLSPVVVDTGVFSSQITGGRTELRFAYRALLEGRLLKIAFVTEAELRYGARKAEWGSQRLARLEAEISQVQTIWPVEESSLLESYVSLRTWAVQAGHGIGQKDHEADRWIAATAMWLDVPLVAHDGVFRGVEGLDLMTLLPA